MKAYLRGMNRSPAYIIYDDCQTDTPMNENENEKIIEGTIVWEL